MCSCLFEGGVKVMYPFGLWGWLPGVVNALVKYG